MLENAVIYCRVSSEEQAKHGYSIENQKRQCVEFAEKQGYYVAQVFVDEGKSAKNLDRPEIQELMLYCSTKRNKIKAVIIWRLDRISRNNSDYHGALRPLFGRMGIKLLSATEANVNTIEGELMRNINMNFAEYEREVIGARTLAGLRQKANQGEYPHKAPIGYKNITREDGSKTIVIDEKQAFYVRRAFELYDSGAYSIDTLTKQLFKDGFRTAKGNKIPKTSIAFLLKNIFYTGVFEFDGVIIENAKHKALITKELYYRVQHRLNDPFKGRRGTWDLVYSGLLKCGHCGCQLVGEVKKGKYVYYHCTGNKGGNCKRDYINEVNIDKVISEVLKDIIIPKEIKDKIHGGLREEHLKQNNYTKEIKANLQKQITLLENRIEKLFQDKLDDNIEHDEWKRLYSKWQVEKDKLIIQRDEIHKLDNEFYRKANTLLTFVDNAYEYYLKGTKDEKRRLVDIITDGIYYKDKELNVELKPLFYEFYKANEFNKLPTEQADRLDNTQIADQKSSQNTSSDAYNLSVNFEIKL